MQRTSMFYLYVSRLTCLSCVVFFTPFASGQEAESKKTVEPVFRVPKVKEQSEGASVAASPTTESAIVQSTDQNNGSTSKPVARVADASSATSTPDKMKTELVPKIDAAGDGSAHPLDRAIQIARVGLENMQTTIHDYTAVMVKRERVGDQLRRPHVHENQDSQPAEF